MTNLTNIYEQLLKWGKKIVVSRQEERRSTIDYAVHYKVEEVLFYERVMRFCYESLGMMVHNRMTRHQCQQFTQWSTTYEIELKKILDDPTLSDIKVEKKYQAYTLPTDDMTVESILDLALTVAGHRLVIYQELRNSLETQKRILLNYVISHVMDEIKFLNREKEMTASEVFHTLPQ